MSKPQPTIANNPAAIARIKTEQERREAEDRRLFALENDAVKANGGRWLMDRDSYNTIFNGGGSSPFGSGE